VFLGAKRRSTSRNTFKWVIALEGYNVLRLIGRPTQPRPADFVITVHASNSPMSAILLLVIVHQKMESQAGLAQVPHALDPPGLRLGLSEHWQKQRRQNPDNCDHHQHLHQGECFPPAPLGQ
jgi:hypothetical protein